SLSYSSRLLENRTQLDEWISGSDESTTPRWLGQTAVDELRPGERISITSVSIDPEALGLNWTLPTPGSYRMAVHYAAGDTSVFERSSFIWQPDGAADHSQRVVIAAPVTVPADGVGTLPAADLERYTAPGGTLSRQLDALEDREVAIGIDPRIIVSIRVLGSAAPDSAVAWLERLGDLDNTIFPLQYGDADPALTVQAASDAGIRLESLPQLGSLEYAIDPRNFVETVPELIPTLDPSPAGTATDSSVTPSSSPTPSDEPEPEPDAEDLPSREQLLDWDYSTDTVVWPSASAVTTSMLPVFDGPDEQAADTIVSSAQLSAAEDTVLSASARVGDSQVLVSDAPLSAYLMDAAAAPSAQARDEAMNDLYQVLGVIASSDTAAQREASPLLLTADRSWVDNTAAFGEAVDEINKAAGVSLSPLTSLQSSDRTEVALTEGKLAEDLRDPAAQLLSDQQDLVEFSSALTAEDADEFLGKERAQVLALLSHEWRSDPEGWNISLAEHAVQTEQSLSSITLVTVSQINVISGQASLPFTVRNDLPFPVTITLTATPDNPRLTVDPEATATIAAGAHSSLPLGVKARLGNGDVTLQVQLSTDSGVDVGEPTEVLLNVRADWEGIGILVLGSLVGLLFIGGLIRTVRRRRVAKTAAQVAAAERKAEQNAGTDAAPNAASDVAHAADTNATPDTDAGTDSGSNIGADRGTDSDGRNTGDNTRG
ncbi:MAG: DUF6049 family protein, partial [Mycetocola sp.]